MHVCHVNVSYNKLENPQTQANCLFFLTNILIWALIKMSFASIKHSRTQINTWMSTSPWAWTVPELGLSANSAGWTIGSLWPAQSVRFGSETWSILLMLGGPLPSPRMRRLKVMGIREVLLSWKVWVLGKPEKNQKQKESVIIIMTALLQLAGIINQTRYRKIKPPARTTRASWAIQAPTEGHVAEVELGNAELKGGSHHTTPARGRRASSYHIPSEQSRASGGQTWLCGEEKGKWVNTIVNPICTVPVKSHIPCQNTNTFNVFLSILAMSPILS